jgi:hypothetical protein
VAPLSSLCSSSSIEVSSDSAAKIGAESRSAIAMLSDGRASICTTPSLRLMCSSA